MLELPFRPQVEIGKFYENGSVEKRGRAAEVISRL